MASQRTIRTARQLLMWVGIAALALLLIGTLKGAWTVYQSLSRATVERANAEAEYARLIERKDNLEKSIQSLATVRGVEEEIRARYPLVRPGEEEFILVGVDGPPVDTNQATRESIWSTIKEWFGW